MMMRIFAVPFSVLIAKLYDEHKAIYAYKSVDLMVLVVVTETAGILCSLLAAFLTLN